MYIHVSCLGIDIVVYLKKKSSQSKAETVDKI